MFSYLKSKLIRRTLFIFSFIILLLLVFYNNQHISINNSDRYYLELFLQKWHIAQTPQTVHRSFDNELNFISTIQDSVQSEMQLVKIPHQYFGNVRFYYENHKGFCYDRAILLEKLLNYYNFSFRHVYIYFGTNGSPATFIDFFKKKRPSHAALEVLTRRGWMAVGTNANWLGLTANNQLLTFGQLRERLNQGILKFRKMVTLGVPFWNENNTKFRFIYGLYSRHGDFFTNHSVQKSAFGFPHFLPDYNLRMLLYNF